MAGDFAKIASAGAHAHIIACVCVAVLHLQCEASTQHQWGEWLLTQFAPPRKTFR
eukprot:CAMPEP_0179233138 /NCGR_PEP_ID=MMETSP0797-20121207/12217_1 /TAXON_ID=47934 /ORGANISM="Dinophysis acuminata, Strain DAEP01" /LENGTH=54 /DNA_ID=CAMNT_0020940273 /DNA_START=418 /DNA_END=579 /DNA_ORIENTATION=-